MTRKMPLTKGKFAIVDDQDYEFLNQWKWTFDGHYAARHIRENKTQKQLRMHRAILNPPSGMEVDHINHDTLDNRRSNLRICTRVENCANSRMRRANTSGVKGVYWQKSISRWVAMIGHQGKTIYLGCSKDKQKVAKLYEDKAQELYGEYSFADKIAK